VYQIVGWSVTSKAIWSRIMENSDVGRKPVTPVVLSWFFALATCLCLAAGISVLAPNTPIRAIWAIKPTEYDQLLDLAPWSGLGFLLLSGAMAATSWGAIRRTRWGWTLAIAIFVINGVGDAARALMGDVVEGLIGVTIAGSIVVALSQRRVRKAFSG
jgi:hypothetical protein